MRITHRFWGYIGMKLTVGQYQQLYAVAKSDLPVEEKQTQSVAILTGKTDEEVDNMPMIEFLALAREATASVGELRLNTKPVSFLRSGKKLYQVNYKVGTLRAGQNTELQHWLKEADWIGNMDKILASIVVPIKSYLWVKLPTRNRSEDHEKVSEDMQQVDFSEAYGSVVFFCKVFAASINGIQPFLGKAMTKAGKTREEIQDFQTALTKTLDGFTTQSEWQN